MNYKWLVLEVKFVNCSLGKFIRNLNVLELFQELGIPKMGLLELIDFSRFCSRTCSRTGYLELIHCSRICSRILFLELVLIRYFWQT